MFSEKNIVITIGNYGAVIALHEGNIIKNKIFLDELNENSQEQIKQVFTEHKNHNIYILLDTAEQSYKKKIYPSVNRRDLANIIKRDMSNDGDRDGLKSYIILNQKKDPKVNANAHRWEVLFVSAAASEILNQWIEFLLEMPNQLVAIYMLPVESSSLFQLLKSHLKPQTKLPEKSVDLYCFIINNKVSGVRQIVFSEQGIVFTRVVNYKFDQPDFLEKYEHDIYSTFEYLKRLFPELSISELDIVNIFPAEILGKIKSINNIELNFINYTPYSAASEIGYSNLLPQNSQYCDLLISKTFSKGKKVLKFSTPKIKILERFFLTLRASYYFNLFVIMGICIMALVTIYTQLRIDEAIAVAENEKISVMQEFSRMKNNSSEEIKSFENGELIDIDRITDFGKLDEVLGKIGEDNFTFYASLKFLKDFNVRLNKFSYSLSGYNNKSPSTNTNYQITFGGEIFNKSGDIEDLFDEFDNLVAQTQKNLSNNQLKYNDLPRDIDFNKKYYSFPVEFSATNKPQ